MNARLESTTRPEKDRKTINVHVAERQLTCDGAAGPWRVTLADGRKVYGEGNTWPITIGESDDLPFNARVLSFGTSGSPEVVSDNSPRIADAFASLKASRPNRVDARSGGCSVGGPHPSNAATWLLLALGGLGVRSRRRRYGGVLQSMTGDGDRGLEPPRDVARRGCEMSRLDPN